MGIGCELLEQRVVLELADHCLQAEFLELLSSLFTSDEGGDLDGAGLERRVFEQADKDRATDVA